MEYDINKLHAVLVEILDYFVSVCEKNNLRYYLVYGTALGAYRHKGFIPWDDDLDVAMPREDYQMLLSILEKKPDKRYSIQNESNEKNWFLSFSKLRKNNTLFLEGIAQDIYQNNGMYIDIFPLDFVYDEKSPWYKIKLMNINYLRHGLKFIACRNLYRSKESLSRYALDVAITFPVYLIGRKNALNMLNKMRIGIGEECDATIIAEYDDTHALKIPKSVYGAGRKMFFEGKEYVAPYQIEEYLSIIYGRTYMELPPLEERRTHQPEKVNFDMNK